MTSKELLKVALVNDPNVLKDLGLKLPFDNVDRPPLLSPVPVKPPRLPAGPQDVRVFPRAQKAIPSDTNSIPVVQ